MKSYGVTTLMIFSSAALLHTVMYMVPFIWYLVLISESSAEFSDDSTTCFPAFHKSTV